jgi:hypothetical protein
MAALEDSARARTGDQRSMAQRPGALESSPRTPGITIFRGTEEDRLPHEATLITTVAAALVVALPFGLLASPGQQV